jgi:hypothetical protein
MGQGEKTYIHVITQDKTEKFMITEKTEEWYKVLDPNENWYYRIKYLGKVRIIKILAGNYKNDNTNRALPYQEMPWATKTIIIWEKWKEANALFRILSEEERKQLQDNK